IGDGADARAERAAIEDEIEDEDEGDGGRENGERQHADVQFAAEMDSLRLDRAARHFADIGAIDALQSVLDDDREAEGREHDRQYAFTEKALEQQALQQV